MENSSRSPYGSYIQLCRLFGVKPDVITNTTLNEKFNIFKNEVPLPTEEPIIRYLAIGNGGHASTVSANSVSPITGVRRKTRAAALYNHIPFILRELDNDLPPTERIKYRLRRIEQYNGVSYVAYYLRVIDLDGLKPVIEHRNLQGDNYAVTPFQPDAADLSPVADIISTETTPSSIEEGVSVSMRISMKLTTSDVNEILNATSIIFNSTGYGIVSEIGVVTGIDRDLTGNFNGVSETYREAIYTQLYSSLNVGKLLNFGTPTSDTIIEVGSIDPIY